MTQENIKTGTAKIRKLVRPDIRWAINNTGYYFSFFEYMRTMSQNAVAHNNKAMVATPTTIQFLLRHPDCIYRIFTITRSITSMTMIVPTTLNTLYLFII